MGIEIEPQRRRDTEKIEGGTDSRVNARTDVMMPNETQRDPLTEKIIGAVIEVHKHLGPGLLESAYEECLCWELQQTGLALWRQVPLPVVYKAVHLELGYRIDVIVEDRVVVELKTVERLMAIHEAQLLTYLRLSGISTGLLLNFHSAYLKDGILLRVLS